MVVARDVILVDTYHMLEAVDGGRQTVYGHMLQKFTPDIVDLPNYLHEVVIG